MMESPCDCRSGIHVAKVSLPAAPDSASQLTVVSQRNTVP